MNANIICKLYYSRLMLIYFKIIEKKIYSLIN